VPFFIGRVYPVPFFSTKEFTMLLAFWRGYLRRQSPSRQHRPAKPARPRSYRLRLEPLEDRLLLSTFLVTTTADAGAGSFRQAILDANATPEPNTIAFDIGGGGVQTIQPLSSLPVVTRPVVIDGTTQPGFAGTPLIVLNGSSAGFMASGLRISAGNSTVQGLVINSFSYGDGIELRTNGGDLITGNYIGTDVTGTKALGNYHGVAVTSNNNMIGGTTAAARNLISGNGSFGFGNFTGILIAAGATGNLVQGNYIGTDVTGTKALGNTLGGVVIEGDFDRTTSDNTIGGTAPGAGNLISGNRGPGVVMAYATGNRVQGNFIGTDVTGTKALGNSGGGVAIGFASNNNTIGGTATGAGNLISGNRSPIPVNRSPGVVIAYATGNLVQGNFIGTDVTGTTALGNGNGGVEINRGSNNTIGGTAAGAGNLISGNREDGLRISDSSGNLVQGNSIGIGADGAALGNDSNGVALVCASNNLIGGPAAGAANTIAYNGRDGVLVDTGTGNAIRRNAIFANGGLGIELINGGNRMQPAPVLTTATVQSDVTTIGGMLTSTPNASFTLEFFVNSACNPSGFGEGEQFFVSVTVTTDGDGRASFEFSLNLPVPVDDFITATATDADENTSMFSRCLQVTEPGG
jgi:titin